MVFLKLPEDVVPTQVIRQLNANQQAYSLPDHLKLYVDDGREDYVRFQETYGFYDELFRDSGLSRSGGSHTIVFTSMLALLCGRDNVEGKALLRHASKPWDQGNPKLAEMLRSGEMKLNPSKGVATLDYLLKLINALPTEQDGGNTHRRAFAHLRTREYLCAIHYLLHYRSEHTESANEAFDPEVFLQQAKGYPKKLLRPKDQGRTWVSSLRHIQEVYNHKRGRRKQTYLVSQL